MVEVVVEMDGEVLQLERRRHVHRDQPPAQGLLDLHQERTEVKAKPEKIQRGLAQNILLKDGKMKIQ